MLIILFFMVIQIVTIFYSAFIFPALFLGPHSFCSHFQTQFSIPDVTFSFLRGNLCLFSSSDEKKREQAKRTQKIYILRKAFPPLRFGFFSLSLLFFPPPRAQYDKFKALFAYFPCIINSQFFHNQKPNSSLSRSFAPPTLHHLLFMHTHFGAIMLNPHLIYIVNAVIN